MTDPDKDCDNNGEWRECQGVNIRGLMEQVESVVFFGRKWAIRRKWLTWHQNEYRNERDIDYGWDEQGKSS